MSDLIDRQAAIDFIDAGHLVNPDEKRYSENDIVALLKVLPTAEPRKITPDKFRDKMIEIQKRNDNDPEMTHIYMDKFMCKTLKLLGYGEGVEVFEKQDKWYS